MRQPFLHDAEVVLAAPAQAWSRADGTMAAPVDGLFVSDVRVVSRLDVAVEGSTIEPVRTSPSSASEVAFTALLRGLDAEQGADPRVRLDRVRTVSPDGMREVLTVRSGRDVPVDAVIAVRIASDLAPMPLVKAGGAQDPAVPAVDGDRATWGAGSVTAELRTDGFEARRDGDALLLEWRAHVDSHGTASASWTVTAQDAAAVVAAPAAPIALATAPTGVPDLDAWTTRALGDLEALQLVLPSAPGEVFLAAGAPWFLTLFGRDSIWAARMLLPLDTRIALGTLRVLAALQGTTTDDASGERPGGVLHELRRGENALSDGAVLPPRYYGTIDATPLWILLLHDAWRAGLRDEEVAGLLPALRAALGWLRDAVPADGFLSYHDASGHGLANQGWKDSGDSVQWHDGRLATGPIALCEVQGYAHEAALAAVVLLQAFGDPDGAAEWRTWAAALKARFRDAFWVDGADGGFPAIALDADGHRVDSLTSNIGHLLGTGILDAEDERRVAALLVDPRLDSGLGLRTLASDSAGYWPLSYHGGSVWAHDTAIAVHGLLRAGFPAEAERLATGLLAAARAFAWRMPELHGGDPAAAGSPVPYPAACRPQAWSAAAAVVVRDAVGGSAQRGRIPAPTGSPDTAG
ncbi:glycogen debranching N-terminal domain-containing protein [Amnibacterium kyonggiense]|uniref:Glycogen debranching enzyme n=1 Tax=Amnibacterium kyonggiense TaxID=595671 RepID=A0A4R7FKS4_9MICO|nr:glycogen debranching N-terminal domain-containing protein [Amnibacterium kyonggiense]TDS76966.1 glycogen debranching enzyme [Amnibacterium kyonggiense]